MSPTIAVSLFLILALVSSVNCWIINNINYPELKRQLTMEFGDYDNEVSSDELARGFTLIYPGMYLAILFLYNFSFRSVGSIGWHPLSCT